MNYVYLIPSHEEYREEKQKGTMVSMDWKDAWEEHYVFIANFFVGCDPVERKNFDSLEKCYSKIDFIRAQKNKIIKPQSDSEEIENLLIFCALITDQRLLAAQTREAVSQLDTPNKMQERHINNMVNEYGQVNIEEDAHSYSKEHLREYWEEGLWVYFSDENTSGIPDGILESMLKLLDAFKEDCASHGKNPPDCVEIPDVNDLNIAQLPDYDSLEYSRLIAENTNISLSKTHRELAWDYFDKLTVRKKIALPSTDMFSLFCHKVLQCYCKQYSLVKGSKHPMRTERYLMAYDCEEKLIPQVEKFRELASQLYAVRQYWKSCPVLTEKIRESCAEALKKHDEQVGSCRIRSDDPAEREISCDTFMEYIARNWEKLHRDPFRIYQIWLSKEQNHVVNKKYKAETILKNIGDQKITDEDPEKNAANLKLLEKLETLCFPEECRETFWKLQKTDFSKSVFDHIRDQVENYIQTCLLFEADDFMDKPVNLEHSKFAAWLEKDPPILRELKKILSSSEFRGLRKLFYTFHMKDPAVAKNRRKCGDVAWRDVLYSKDPETGNSAESVLHKIYGRVTQDELLQDLPELKCDSQNSREACHLFLITWALLQMEIEDAKKSLYAIRNRIMGDDFVTFHPK